MTHHTHKSRMSDASSFDEICSLCGATDARGMALLDAPCPKATILSSPMKRFTAYRRNISARDTHNEFQKNADDLPQYEGVVFTDGTVVIRWLTPCRSTSTWDSLQHMLNIHGHPEYGTEILWHDHSEIPPEWTEMVRLAALKVAPAA